MISQSELRDLVSYDPETGAFRWRSDRYCGRNLNRKMACAGDAVGSINALGYHIVRFGKKDYSAHRLAWLYVHGKWPQELDHVNGDRSDNRIANLRECTSSQNKANQKIRSDSTSGLKGVFKQAGCNSWYSRIRKNGKLVYLGSFPTPELAHAAYARAAREIHGEFARAK